MMVIVLKEENPEKLPWKDKHFFGDFRHIFFLYYIQLIYSFYSLATSIYDDNFDIFTGRATIQRKPSLKILGKAFIFDRIRSGREVYPDGNRGALVGQHYRKSRDARPCVSAILRYKPHVS